MSATHVFDAAAGSFQHERLLACAASDIFAAFADPERLALWWGPAGFSNTFEIFEFKPGGKWKFVMHGPDGSNYPNESEFASIEPNQRVVIKHCCEPFFTLTVTLQPSADGTYIIWRQVFDNPAVAERVRHICENGNEQNLDRLQQLLKESLP